jgi:DNA-directed RNA polymerase subunit H
MSTVVEQVLKSFETLCQMLRDREVDTEALSLYGPVELEKLCTTNVFTIKVNDALNIVYYLVKMRVGDFKNVLAKPDSDDSRKHHIFVFKDALTSSNQAAVMQRFTHPRNQVFSLEELQYNVTLHRLVPKHVKLSPEQTQKVLETFQIKLKDMSTIYRSDPVAKYLGLMQGDVVRIVRPSPTAAQYDIYRQCVAG